MKARDEIFKNIRSSLGVAGAEAPRRESVLARLKNHPRGIVPAMGGVLGAERVALFKSMAKGSLASVCEAASFADVPAETQKFLREGDLPPRLRMGADETLGSMNWEESGLDIRRGPSAGDDSASISHAFAGVAEAGALVMLSGPQNPTTLNFLPDNHIVVVEAHRIVSDFESVFDLLREDFGEGAMPRAMNWIAGPSRSADIAQTMLLGAHGPRKLHIVIVAG